MGIVYRATQLSLGRPVAVKLIAPGRAGDPGFRERFERESRVAAAIDHPNVIPVYAAGEEGGHLYLVMRYVKGTDLQGLLARERCLPAARVASIAVPDRRGARRRARGRAGAPRRQAGQRPAQRRACLPRRLRPVAVVGTDTRLTSTGQWIGTVDFMAPEQFSGAEVDARADVYALGCVLHDALTGEVPYPRGTVPATMLAHMHDTPPRPTAIAADVPAGLRPRDRPRARERPRATLPVGRRSRPRGARRGRGAARDRDRADGRARRSRSAGRAPRERPHRGHGSRSGDALRRSARPATTGRRRSRARRCPWATGHGAGCGRGCVLARGRCSPGCWRSPPPAGRSPSSAARRRRRPARARRSTSARSRTSPRTSPRRTATRTAPRSAGC